jgi:hypothetical protein
MKKVMTVIFSAMIALALSVPAWAQNTPTTPSQGKPAATASKTDKKNAKAKAKANRKAKRAAKKAANTNNTNNPKQ